MVTAVAGRIASLVARATPAAFAGIDRACAALETEIGESVSTAVSERDERALRAVIALKAACEVRKQLRRTRRK